MPINTESGQNPQFQPTPYQNPTVGSTMGSDVAAAQALANGQPYRERFAIDPESGELFSQVSASSPVPMLEFRKEGDTQVAYIKELATGSVVAQRPSAWEFTNQDSVFDSYTNASLYSLNYNHRDGKQDIRKAVYYWLKDPLVYKCVKFLTQLSNGRMVIECEDDNFRDLVEIWVDMAMGHDFREQWFREYFRSGFVVTLKTLVPYVPREYKYNKIPQSGDTGLVRAQAEIDAEQAKSKDLVKCQAAAEQDYRREAARLKTFRESYAQGLCSAQRLKLQAAIVVRTQYQWLKGMVPAAYSLLDPITVSIEGPPELELLHLPYLYIGAELRDAVMRPTPQQEEIIKMLPVEIVDQIQAGAVKVWLSPNICSITTPDKQGYERYPTPMLRHAFEALEMKQGLMAADRRTLQSVRDRILKVTIGSDLHPVRNDSSLVNLSNLFNNPNRSLTVFWNHTLKIEWVEPPLDSFMDPIKYELWNNEIRMAYGISSVFTGTGEGGTGDSMMNFKGLEEEVTSAQEAFLQFLREQIRLLKQALSVGHEVNLRFTKVNMKNEAEFVAVVQGLVQNGILDPRTAIEAIGFNYPVVLKRLEQTQKLRKKGLFVPTPSANNLGPDGLMMDPGVGGKPRNAPLADNNKNRKGKSQVKTKAKAAVQIVPDGTCRLVVDADHMEPDAHAQMAEVFGIDARFIMTKASFKEQYGRDVKFIQPLPPLSTREAIAIGAESQRVLARVVTEAHAGIEKLKTENKGKRGPWLTKAKKTEVVEAAQAAVLTPLQVIAEEWSDWYNGCLEETNAEGVVPAQAEAELWTGDEYAFLCRKIEATLMVKRRHEKLLVELAAEQKAEAA